MIAARYTNDAKTEGVLSIDGRDYFGPLPPNDGPLLGAYDRWIADGNAPAPYVAPPAPEPVQSPDVRLAEILIAEGVITAAKAQKVRDRLKSPLAAPRAIKSPKMGKKRSNG